MKLPNTVSTDTVIFGGMLLQDYTNVPFLYSKVNFAKKVG
jgi:hypothetical protein